MPVESPLQKRISRRTVMALIAAHAVLIGSPGAASKGLVWQRLGALGPGFNVPDWADREGGKAPRTEVLERLRALGFRSVRLPIDGARIVAGGTPVRSSISLIRSAINSLLRHGFTVTVDLHSAPLGEDAFGSAPRQAEDSVAAAWMALAPLVAEFPPDQVFPELLNEPPMEREQWLRLRERLAEIVRGECPHHTLIWGAARHQGIWETLETPVLADDNAAAAIHYYTPMGFTHQCENWSGSARERLGNLPFPADPDAPEVAALRRRLLKAGDSEAVALLNAEFASPWSNTQIASDFSDIGRWSEANQCPVVLNEFGVLAFCVDPESRARWIEAVRRSAERNGLAWNYWELDQGFGFIADRRADATIDPAMLQALLGGARSD